MEKEITKINSKQVGIIDIDDFKDPLEDMNVVDRKKYVANISVNFAMLEKELKHMIYLQTDFIAREADSWEKVMIGRGGINVMYLLLERFNKLNNEHKDNVKPKEEFDKYEVV